jgi:hypothetical protein
MGVLLHDPHFFIDALHMLERAGTREGFDPPQAVVVVFQRLLAHNNVPAAGKGAQHEIFGA